jgi:hypothetical protein
VDDGVFDCGDWDGELKGVTTVDWPNGSFTGEADLSEGTSEGALNWAFIEDQEWSGSYDGTNLTGSFSGSFESPGGTQDYTGTFDLVLGD